MRIGALLVALATPALAQDLSARIPIGGEVQLRTRGLIVSSIKGKVAGIDENTVRVAVTKAGSSVQLPWNNVERIEWTRGRSRLLGLGEGALVGLILGASLFSDYPFGVPDSPERRTQIRRITQVATVVFAGSALLGAAIGSRRWDGAPIPRSTAGEITLDLAADDELRVESSLGRVTGRNGVAGDSLRLTTSSGSLTLPWRNVGELEVRAGRNRFLGILLGAGAGVLAASIAESFIDVSNAGFVMNVAAGGALGYRYFTPGGWKALPIPRR